MYQFETYLDYKTALYENWEQEGVAWLLEEGLLKILSVDDDGTVYRPLSEVEYHTYLQEKNNRAGNAIL